MKLKRSNKALEAQIKEVAKKCFATCTESKLPLVWMIL